MKSPRLCLPHLTAGVLLTATVLIASCTGEDGDGGTTPGTPAAVDVDRTADELARGHDKPILDTHVHLFQVTRPGGVPWPEDKNKTLYKDTLPAHYEAVARPLGILGTGVVEASPLQTDTRWVLDQTRGNAFFRFYVAQLEVGSADFIKNLDEVVADPRVVGIRGFLWSPVLTLDARQLGHLEELARRGLSLDLISRGTLNPKDKVDQLARAVPDLRIIIDHLGGARTATVDPQWEQGMRKLALNKNVYVKFSAFFDMFNPAATEDEPWAAPTDLTSYRAHFAVLLEAFGADRLIWGSNWPVITLGGQLADQIKIAEAFLATRDRVTRDKVMFRNAFHFYRRHTR